MFRNVNDTDKGPMFHVHTTQTADASYHDAQCQCQLIATHEPTSPKNALSQPCNSKIPNGNTLLETRTPSAPDRFHPSRASS